ncbi:hypothetical protein TELCIR_12705 [Teladorsagia circumcincta]|uniref:Exportin-T n=1 Tax=Teladorsagia circumcincta TaxID=45464 RepID=A0A2G9U628_TELCI|nr:hypothetical protein TELCIR_12705 [Teladorsagia circumcincta]
MLTKIVSVCLRRFVISEELDVDGSGEDEIEFAEYRKELRGVLNTIGNMRCDLIVAPLEVLVEEVAASGGGTAMPIARLEAIVQLVHGLVEIIPANFVNMKEGWMGRGALLPVNLLNSMQLDGRSATVHVLFFEVITRLAPLLAMSPQSDQLLTADDQAFIFEATGTLIVFGELGVEQKSLYIGELANKLGERFLAAITELQAARAAGDSAKIQMIQQFMTNIVGYCRRNAYDRVSISVQFSLQQLAYQWKLSQHLPYGLKVRSGTLFDDLQEAATQLALSSDQSCQKLALATLSRTSAGNAQWWQRTLRTALEVPSLSHISSSDAGSTVVVHEVASTLQTLRQAHPEEFSVAVRSLMPGELGLELLSMLENLKSRALDKQLLLMYDKIRLAQQQQQQQQ